MRCAQCGAELKEGVLFCRDCGAKVEKIRKKRFCTECGTEYPEGARFCSSCGANLALQGAVPNINHSSEYIFDDITASQSPNDIQDDDSNLFHANSDVVDTATSFNNVNDGIHEDTISSNYTNSKIEDNSGTNGTEDKSAGSTTENTSSRNHQKEAVFMSGFEEKQNDNNIDSLQNFNSSVKTSIQQILSQDRSPSDKFKEIIHTIWKSLDLFCRVVAVAALVSVFLLTISILTHRGIISFVLQAGSLAVATLIHEGRIKTSNSKAKYFILVFAIFLTIINARSFFVNASSARSDRGNVVTNTDNSAENSALSNTIPAISEDQKTIVKEGIHSYPIKNYIGKNLASFGRKNDGYAADKYGSAYLRLIYVTSSGAYISPDDIDELKEYMVIDQNIEAGTKFVLVNERNSDGEPYSNLVCYQNYEEIVLAVKKVDADEDQNVELTSISPTLDIHKWHVRDYVGRNLASFGTTRDINRIDKYGEGELTLMYVSDDGRYIDPTSLSELRQYVVSSQETEPNALLSFEYHKDFEGNEYSNWVDSQNMEEIVLHVRKIDESIIAGYKDLPDIGKEEEKIDSSEGDTETVKKDTDTDGVPSTKEDEVAVPADAYSYRNEDYKEVKKKLSEAGFTSISTKKQYDIFWGWTKEGTVESVSIDGNTDFEEGDVFKKDADIVITYHLKIEDDPANQAKEELKEIQKEFEETVKDAFDDLDIVEEDTEKTENDSEQITEPETVSYSTNTIDTVKDGSSGVYSYIKEGPQYDQYYIIDFEEGYVYSFDQGSSEDCDRLKIESGDLKSGVIITYHDGEDVWSYELYFEEQNNPEHLIMKDNDGFTYDYYPTGLEDAVKLKDSKYVHDY